MDTALGFVSMTELSNEFKDPMRVKYPFTRSLLLTWPEAMAA
jgi:hypothetical protein